MIGKDGGQDQLPTNTVPGTTPLEQQQMTAFIERLPLVPKQRLGTVQPGSYGDGNPATLFIILSEQRAITKSSQEWEAAFHAGWNLCVGYQNGQAPRRDDLWTWPHRI